MWKREYNELLVKSGSHVIEELLGIIVDGIDESLQDEHLLLGLEVPDIDFHGVAGEILENATASPRIRREPLERGPPELFLVVEFIPERRGSVERVLGGVPHGVAAAADQI